MNAGAWAATRPKRRGRGKGRWVGRPAPERNVQALYRGCAVLPVGVAEAALEQLAVGVAGQFFDEVDALRPLHPGQPAVERGQDLRGGPIAGGDARGRLHDGLDLLTPLP